MKKIPYQRLLRLLIFLPGCLFSAAYAMTPPSQYAMVFFFRSDCPYCHRFAPKLERFTRVNALPTYAFTLDGKGLNTYPVPIPATPDISQRFFDNPRNITVPATFLINVNSGKYVRVSIGDVSYAELAQSVNGILNDPSVMETMQ
ncbi:type-F conjugative transfer system pilin assembly thiol-disulfide isomerase TrbB [Vibrio mimicus]|uniref:type-F conjugative transfer system pilin assembly thiol-disulfide isomerase TrbB n=1 Tax=Vibrio mimicus TaxID=674 RepID=UPI0039E17609